MPRGYRAREQPENGHRSLVRNGKEDRKKIAGRGKREVEGACYRGNWLGDAVGQPVNGRGSPGWILIWDMSAREWDTERNHPYTFGRVRFRDNRVALSGKRFRLSQPRRRENDERTRRERREDDGWRARRRNAWRARRRIAWNGGEIPRAGSEIERRWCVRSSGAENESRLPRKRYVNRNRTRCTRYGMLISRRKSAITNS